mmetsp:Transcript_6482/g.17625  ORF Transcript_6482/g.17625 Transcript_6482/m.17625 type:complete len:92 (+) Transcript_6482:353-628(+)
MEFAWTPMLVGWNGGCSRDDAAPKQCQIRVAQWASGTRVHDLAIEHQQSIGMGNKTKAVQQKQQSKRMIKCAPKLTCDTDGFVMYNSQVRD